MVVEVLHSVCGNHDGEKAGRQVWTLHVSVRLLASGLQSPLQSLSCRVKLNSNPAIDTTTRTRVCAVIINGVGAGPFDAPTPAQLTALNNHVRRSRYAHAPLNQLPGLPGATNKASSDRTVVWS